jgi:glycosyltransferase involved in cell wall biosynthesis
MPRRQALAVAPRPGRSLRIGIDLHGTQGASSGVGRYARCLLAAIAEHPGPWSLHVLCPRELMANYQPPRCATTVRWLPGAALLHRRGIVDLLWHWLVFPLLVWQRRLDVVLVAVERRLPFWSPVPVVGTVHDLAPLAFPGKYGRLTQAFHRYAVPLMLRWRRRLICVSLHTARDVRHRAQVSAPRLAVIWSGVDTARFGSAPADTGVCKRLGLDGRFVLYPARLEHPGKNHVGAIRALRAYHERTGLPLRLVCVGAPWQGVEAIHAEVAACGLSDAVVFTGPISDTELVDLYHRARALVFPSHYEGFGLPLVEAMAAGLPIIASASGGAVPEIVGAAGLLADADDPAAFAAAIAAVVDNPERAARFTAIGHQRAERFVWARCAKQTLAVLHAQAGH